MEQNSLPWLSPPTPAAALGQSLTWQQISGVAFHLLHFFYFYCIEQNTCTNLVWRTYCPAGYNLCIRSVYNLCISRKTSCRPMSFSIFVHFFGCWWPFLWSRLMYSHLHICFRSILENAGVFSKVCGFLWGKWPASPLFYSPEMLFCGHILFVTLFFWEESA